MNNQVYLLYHIRPEGQLLLVGVYESEKDAKAAIERLKGQPGFVEYPEGFEYHAYGLGADIWSEGFAVDEVESDSGGRRSSSPTKIH